MTLLIVSCDNSGTTTYTNHLTPSTNAFFFVTTCHWLIVNSMIDHAQTRSPSREATKHTAGEIT